MKLIRWFSVILISTIGLLLIRSGLVASQAAVPAILPHLGYGLNVWQPIDSVQPLGFDWIKLFESLGPPPATRLPTKVLYRVIVDGYPPSLSDYLNHIRDLVQAGRDKVEAYEIGNEPNLRGYGFWGQTNVNPHQYAQVLCSVYTVIKQIDPQALVVSAGLAPVGRTPPDYWQLAMDERVFTQKLFDEVKSISGGSFCMDAFGYHPHGFAYAPETDYHSVDNGFAFRGSEAIHDIMLANGASNMQLWATEFGWIRDPHNDPWIDGNNRPSDLGWCNNWDFRQMRGFLWMEVSEQQQADYLVRAFSYADEHWPWMGPMFVWNLDFNNKGICVPQQFYSLYHAVVDDGSIGSPALVYTALLSMPKRYVVPPPMAAQPDRLVFLTEVATPTIQTQTINLINPRAISWTASASISGSIVQPVIDPISGTQATTITISIDPSPIEVSGIYSASVWITPDPITASDSITIPISIIATDHLNRAYLPLIQRNTIAPAPLPPTTTPHFTGSLQLGVNFVSSAEQLATPVRYQRAADLKAAFNRQPMYWPNIETDPINQPRNFNWSKQDASIISDTLNGLQVLPILMLTPVGLDTGGSHSVPAPKVGDGFQLQLKPLSPDRANSPSSLSSPPIGLYEGIFANGIITDDVPGKPINPNNRWAYFVNTAVNRYKPGGILAQAQGWLSTTGITHWEIWNEEDLDYFFSGTPTDFARLMKVAYLSARSADPDAQIIFGGMAHFEKQNWLKDVLNVTASDPLSIAYHGYMDAVASHSYAWSWQTFKYLYQDRLQLDARGFNDVRLWLTETGVPVCDDPAPNADPPIEPFCPSPYRSTMSEQADYLIQTLTFAQWLNTETALWFQLVDDCGNDGRYDAYGLISNPASGPCTPRDGTNRLSYDAYKVFVDQVLGAGTYWRDRRTGNFTDWISGTQELIAFKRADTGERVIVMWARSNITETVVLSATSATAQLIFPNEPSQVILPTNGVYSITLPAATNYSTATNDGSAAIGGSPRILIESDPAVEP
jgi:hypothetical protein